MKNARIFQNIFSKNYQFLNANHEEKMFSEKSSFDVIILKFISFPFYPSPFLTSRISFSLIKGSSDEMIIFMV